VHQEITVYLRTEIPKTRQNPVASKHEDVGLKKRYQYFLKRLQSISTNVSLKCSELRSVAADEILT
jgi:hypothetical protein